MREQCKTYVSAISSAGNDAGAAALAYQAGSKVEGFEVGCYAKRKNKSQATR